MTLDPQMLTAGAGTLATIVGLICNWKQEKGSQDQDRFQSFITWLSNHNFNDLKERIFESDDLQRNLNDLLRSDLTEISAKLDTLCSGLSALALRIEGVSGLAESLRAADGEKLSVQACAILKIFADSEADEMIYRTPGFVGGRSHVELYLVGGTQGAIHPDEPRFVSNDLESLCLLGLLSPHGHTGDGYPILVLTRSGARFAAQLAAVPSNS